MPTSLVPNTKDCPYRKEDVSLSSVRYLHGISNLQKGLHKRSLGANNEDEKMKKLKGTTIKKNVVRGSSLEFSNLVKGKSSARSAQEKT